MATKKSAALKKPAKRSTPATEDAAPITVFSYGPAEADAAPKRAGGRKGVYDDLQTKMAQPGFFGRMVERRAQISPDTLKQNLNKFLDSMGGAMAGIPGTLAGFELDEIELSLEVGAEGEIGLLGTGGKLSGKGSITLKLKKPKPT